MRRAGNLWPEVVAFDGLLRATQRAARGSRGSAAAMRFVDRREQACLRLQHDLGAGLWRPGRPATFEIHDPKRRTITAAPFADRVVHHALIAPLIPVFERRMIADSFACRTGRGTHRALRRAQQLLRRKRYSLKLDVASCFASLRHDVVRATLARTIKDRRVLALCDTILAGPNASSAATTVGLPIGSLTSQWFANATLDRLDHVVKQHPPLRGCGYLRYMDDMVLFADDKATLHTAHDFVARYLDTELALRLKARATRLTRRWFGDDPLEL